jgi:hypothetical protein
MGNAMANPFYPEYYEGMSVQQDNSAPNLNSKNINNNSLTQGNKKEEEMGVLMVRQNLD